MARANPTADSQSPSDKDRQSFGMDGELILLAMPVAAYKALSDLAMKRGTTVGRVLEEAVATYLNKE